jgi:hypothetical protein
LRTGSGGGSETEFEPNHRPEWLRRILVLPSRRHFSPYFNRSTATREDYITSNTAIARGEPIHHFGARLFQIQQNGRAAFDAVLGKVLQPIPAWTIDQNDAGHYYLKLSANDAHHSSEGMGEGLVSLLFIIDGLYDSNPGDVVVIDEPELSLHPSLQRKLALLLSAYSSDRQIIVATHSPYFADFQDISNGAQLSRVHVSAGGSVVNSLMPETAEKLSCLLHNDNNPHVLGLDAREVFFLEDNILLTEGQEDVVFYRRVAEKLNIDLNGAFFGWGVGGADNMHLIASLLKDLGFMRVGGLLDKNRSNLAEKLRADFPDYWFEVIPANDVRTKRPTKGRDEVVGLLDERGDVRPEFAEEARVVLQTMARATDPSRGSETAAASVAAKN